MRWRAAERTPALLGAALLSMGLGLGCASGCGVGGEIDQNVTKCKNSILYEAFGQSGAFPVGIKINGSIENTRALDSSLSLYTDLTRNTRAPHFTPQHWLLCHMGLY